MNKRPALTGHKETATVGTSGVRQRAQGYLASPAGEPQAMSREEVRELVRDLDARQVELESENDDLRRLQQEGEQALGHCRDLYEFAPAGYLTVSDTGLIVEANLTAALMLGAEGGQLSGRPFSAFVVDDDQDIFFGNRSQLLSTGEKQISELRFRRLDGPVFQAQMTSALNPELDGQSGRYRTILTGISRSRELAEDLAVKHNLDRTLLDSLPCGAMLVNPQSYEIIAANQAAEESGSTPGTICYRTWANLDAPCPWCLAAEARSSGKPQQLEFPLHGKIWDAYWYPMPSDLVMHYLFDVSQKHQMEDRLQQALKMQAVGTLAGGIAHEFNNLLGIIMGCADMARDEVSEGTFARKQLDKVMKASSRARDLVKQVLTFSRQSQRRPLTAQLLPLVQESVALIASSLPSSVEIRQTVTPGSFTVAVDPTEIQQIVMNVCVNAVDAMKEQGTLEINLKPVKLEARELMGLNLPMGDYALLSFSDTGSGMDRQTLTRIFDPFFTTKEVGRGTGMGLSIVHGIMESYGGKIVVESEVGKGTTFSFYFPISAEPQGVVPSESEDNLQGSERVLFVDDDPMYAEVGEKMIASLGYEVLMTTDSREALAAFSASPASFDLLITDQIMPALSGEELVRAIRAIRPEMPIILCTGYSTQMDEEKARALAINSFALKPITKTALAKLIREVLDQQGHR